ncbi:MAG: winged helix-turn-helix transcriptional regulator [Clostridiales bacterium]|nr:winged helix-turn-helix transcriptional regulator [Clostridiales bacterium]
MEVTKILKAIADETRFKMLKLLLQHNYCVRALARKLGLSESAISQHIKVLKEAGLLIGVKKGYYMHYDVDRDILRQLSTKIEELAAIERELCNPEKVGCKSSEQKICHVRKSGHKCSDEVKSICHGDDREEVGVENHGNCKCHKS